MLAYLRLLIQNRLSAFRLGNFAYGTDHSKNRNLRGLGYVLLYLFAFASVMFLIVVMEMVAFSAFDQLGEPQTMLAFVFMACMLVTLVMSFFFVFSSLFFGKDTQIVAALPISDRSVLTARLVMVILSESLISLVFCAPAIVMYGAKIGAGIGYYLRMLLFVPMLPIIPIAIVTLISFLLIRVSALWKRREGVTVLFSFVFIALILYWETTVTSNIDESDMEKFMMELLKSQRQLINLIFAFFPPIAWLTAAFSGTGLAAWGNGLLFTALSIAVIGIVIFLLGGSYQKLSIRQSEVLAKLNKGKSRGIGKDAQRSPRMALWLAEMREVITTPIYAMNGLSGVILFPILMVIAAINMNSDPQKMGELSKYLSMVTPSLFAGVWTGVLCFCCTMNTAMFTAVSREGKRNYFSRIIPVEPSTQLQAKLMMGLTINGVTMLVMSVVGIVVFPDMWLRIICALVIGSAFSLLSCAVALILDTYRPRYQWKNETEAIKQNVNVILSMLLNIVMIALFVLIYLLLQNLGLSSRSTYIVVSALIILSAAGAYYLTMGAAAKRYYLQEFAN